MQKKKQAEPERYLNVKLRIRESLHRRLKVAAAVEGRTIIEVATEVLDKHLPKLPPAGK